MISLSTPSWTGGAEAALAGYFDERLAAGGLEGVDPAEFRSDIRMHLEEEFAAAGVPVVTAELVQRALTGMGEVAQDRPESQEQRGTPLGKPRPAGPPRRRAGFRRPGAFVFLAVVLPLVALTFELLTGGCAEILFDPVPDVAHFFLVLLAPAGGVALRLATRPDAGPKAVRYGGWLGGAGLAAAVYYAVLFAVIAPISVLAIVAWGLGVLPLVPLVAALALGRGIVILRRVRESRGLNPRTGAKRAFQAGIAVILLLEVPSLVTRIGIHQATSARGDDPDRLAAATRLIRNIGSAQALHRACYDSSRDGLFHSAAPDPAAWVSKAFPMRTTNAPTVRDLYFRVTGVPFNGTERPGRLPALLPLGGMPARQFDDARGGQRVAGRIEGLRLGTSRMDWHCEEASGLTWGEWTLIFRNSTAEAHEARCRIALPPDGFVSRVTLWVNGEPQEAAYGAVADVRAAYQKVAVRQQRDPVLVTQPSPGTILLQAFPIPAGGELKTRITITTAPDSAGRVWLPAIVEQNFGIDTGCTHPLWVQADGGVLTAPAGLNARPVTEQNHPTVRAALPGARLTGTGTFFTWIASPAPVVWAEDPFATAPGEPEIVVRTAGPPVLRKTGDIAWVIDTSASMADARASILSTLNEWRPSGSMRVFLPGDAPDELLEGGTEILTKYKPRGGRDNMAAIEAAIEWLRGRPGAVLIWIHGPQPLDHAPSRTLEQLLERSPSPLTFLNAALVPGEDTIGPVFNTARHVATRVVRLAPGDLGGSLRAALTDSGHEFSLHSDRSSLPENALQVSGTIARVAARERAVALSATDPAAAARLAASRQLVTRLTGAVVLERAADYADNGLTQSDVSIAQTVPVVPEPSTSLFLLLTALSATLHRRR